MKIESLFVCGTVLIIAGCASGEASSSDAAGVGPGGAQDFGAFREMVDDAQIPDPDTLDAVGFFNEHDFVLPDPTCEEDVCLHAQLGVMGNMVNGANCTMLFMGLNTPLDPSELPRPPLDIALALDVSGSMQGAPIENLRFGLELLLPELRAEDRIAIVAFSDDASVRVPLVSPDDEQLPDAIFGLQPSGATNIYAGLSLAYLALPEEVDTRRERRVVLLSDGEATAGLQSADRISKLVQTYADQGTALSVIGVGTEFDASLLRELAINGTGSFYFLDDPLALRDVFIEELQTALVPLAHDAVIDVSVAKGYQLRAIYGVEESELTQSTAHVEIPILQLAHREGAGDADAGRRGGGGVMIVELTPDAATEPMDDESRTEHPVGDVEFSFVRGPRVGSDGTVRSQRIQVTSPLLPGETPKEGLFPNRSVEKGFVMLNLFAGMKGALESVKYGDPQGALTTLDALDSSVSAWLMKRPDADIEDDLEYLHRLRALVAPLAQNQTVESPPSPWPVD